MEYGESSLTRTQKLKSKRRKNISINFATWSRLKTYGIYGDSIDDIFNRLMDKADELNRRMAGPLASASMSVKEQPQQSQPPPHQPIIQTSNKGLRHQFRVFEKDTVKPKPGERSIPGEKSIELDIALPGIKFPINKVELINLAIYLDYIFEYNMIAVEGFYYPLFSDLPDKTYTDKEKLQAAMEVTLGTSNKGFFGEKKKVVGVNLLTTKEEIERDFTESGKKQIDVIYKQINDYYGPDREQKQKIIEEIKRLGSEEFWQREHEKKMEEFWQREHEEYERREREQKREQEEEEREMEEAAVKDAIDKPLKPVETDFDLSD